MNELLRQAAQRAIAAQDELFEAWRAWSHEGKPAPYSDDALLLQELIYRKIYPLNAFELLARLDVEAAIATLLGRYLARHVSPDTGFGGFEFDMSGMLDDLVLFGGEGALLKLLRHTDFNEEMLLDPRFRRSTCEALKLDDAAFATWLTNHPKPAPTE